MTKHVQAPHVKKSHKDNDDVIGIVLHSMVPRFAFLNHLERSGKGLVAVQRGYLEFGGGWKLVMYKCGEDYM